MTQEEKQLLLQDLCSRLPYGVICHANEINIDGELIFVNKLYNIAALYYNNAIGKFESCSINDIKPYLRPMPSMTEEEREEYDDWHLDLEAGRIKEWKVAVYINWLNSHHFDYQGLIEKGLAIEAPNDMYK